jgi:hypothetical protein
MKLSELEKILPILIQNREPVLLKGAPGGGKTSVCKQVAKALDYEMVIRHPVVEESVDSKGLPSFYADENGQPRARFTLTDDWRRLCETTRPTICLIDDLGQAPNSVQAPYMQWLLERQVNGQRVSDSVSFIAATNRRGDAAGVQGLITPLLSRFTAVIDVDFNHEDWVKWGLANGVPTPLIGFARFKPDLIGNSFKPTRDMEPSPTPRGWAAVGRMYGLGLKSHEVWAGAVGEGAATEFKAFVDTYEALPDPAEVKKNPTTYPLPDRPDVRYAIVTSLGAHTKLSDFGAYMKYIARLDLEYQTVYLRDVFQRQPKIINDPAWKSWVQTNKNVLSM